MSDGAALLLMGGDGGQPSTDAPARLSVRGFDFIRPDGAIHRRKGITAFTLPKRVATGRKDDALRFMDWAVNIGLNEFRVFARVDWTGPPGSGVESGWEYDEDACAWVLTEASSRGCYVQVTNIGPFNSVEACATQLQRVDDLCLAHDNAILECCNEPDQNGGHEFLHKVLERYTPSTPGWSAGAYNPTPYTRVVQTGTTPEGRPIYAATGDARVGLSMDYHSPRKDEWSRCFKDAYEFGTGQGPNDQFSPGYAAACMLSEPPQVEQIIRDAGRGSYWPDPAEDWRAYGAGAAFFACGATIHSNPTFQKCEVPTDPTIIACVAAFVAGFGDVPTQRYHGYNRGDPPSSNLGSRRYNRWGDDNRKYEICVRPYSFKAV